MGDDKKEMKVGEILWRDLTVENAVEVRNFYQEVVGWKSTPEDMEGHEDYARASVLMSLILVASSYYMWKDGGIIKRLQKEKA